MNVNTLEQLQAIAKSKKGRCLSKSYIKSATKYDWECSKGHKWSASANSVVNGSWCPKCAIYTGAEKRRSNITQMQMLAERKGGKCISTQYIGDKTHLIWECKLGHQWKTAPGTIKGGRWCPKCARKNTIEKSKETKRLNGMNIWDKKQLDALAERKGGKLLSNNYLGGNIKHEWQCKYNHTWFATATSVVRGSWCPQCTEGISERLTRKIFEILFNEKFTKAKPFWLVNNKNGRLELDGYNEKLKIAFEYQGIQHYKAHSKYHSVSSFNETQSNDRIKKEICLSKNISLIVIPYTVSHSELKNYIINQSDKLGINIPNRTIEIDIIKLKLWKPDKIIELKDLARSKGGECLSDAYITTHTKLKFKCAKNHEWEARPHDIWQGKWCNICSMKENGKKIRKYDLTYVQKFCKEKGGLCLSDSYNIVDEKLVFQCNKGHIWSTTFASILKGSWCPTCASIIRGKKSRKCDLETFIFIAKNKGGECLSTEYRDVNSTLTFKCSKGHKWKITARQVFNGSWCPYCKGLRNTIDDMKKLANTKDRNGSTHEKTRTNDATKTRKR